MKRSYLILALLLLGTLPSCITSLYPLYTEATLIERKDLLGVWKDREGMYWRFMKQDDTKRYRLRCRSHNYTAVYVTGLVRFGNHYFLDVKMEDQPISDEESARLKQVDENPQPKGPKGSTDKNNVGALAYNIPGHSFYKLVFASKKIYVYPFNEDYLEELFKQRKIRIKHEKLDNSTTVLTASSQELQDFFKKYADDPKLFRDDDPLSLTKLEQ